MTETGIHYDSVVVGLGKTGRSVVEFLQSAGQSVAVVDSREQPPELDTVKESYPQVPVFTGGFDDAVLHSARRLVLSPGVSLREPAIKAALDAGVELSSDLELFCQEARAPIVAITGSNGKSSVATVVKLMIEASGKRAILAGNIGLPVLDALKQSTPDFYVLELSSFQLDTVRSLAPLASVVLNITPDHMDRYTDFREYVESKRNIYRRCQTMIINNDDKAVAASGGRASQVIRYGLGEPGESEFGLRGSEGELYLAQGETMLCKASLLKTPGQHNLSNALASLAMGTAIGLPMQAMLEVLQSFGGLPHRCEHVACIQEVNWFNDSKGTNVGASCAAIEGLASSGGLILIAGGEGKNADFQPLAKVIDRYVKTTILIGRDAGRIDQALGTQSQRVFASSLEAAVNTAAELAVPGDNVLLSPACGSQDMFRDYEHRGETFVKLLRRRQERAQ